MSRVPKGFNNDDYCTPMQELALVYAAIGIPDLDPCSNPRSLVISKRQYTRKQDAFKQSWDVRTLFMNPPYSNTWEWVERFLKWLVHPGQYHSVGREAVLLLSAECGLIWWQEQLLPRIQRMILLPRIAFLANGKPIKGARHNSILMYFGRRCEIVGEVWPAPVFMPAPRRPLGPE